MPTVEQFPTRAQLHEEWRRVISERDTKRLIPEARQRVRAIAPFLERMSLNPWRILEALRKTVVERTSIEKDGYLCADRVRNIFVIEVNEDIFEVERLNLTRWHEIAHLICLVGGRGPSHGPVWKAVVRLLGFPEEARDFPDTV